MLRSNKWVASVAGLALVLGFAQAQGRAAETTVPVTDAKASITVTVVNAEGKPVVGAKVDLFAAGKKKSDAAQPNATDPATPAATKQKPTPIASGVTDADGKAVLTKIPDGTYRVVAHMKHAGAGHESVTISDSKDASVSITLKPRKPKAT